MPAVVEAAMADASTLTRAGFPGLMVENFGDAPFHADDVPAVTVAAMTRVASEIATLGVPFGVNVLRNDGLAAVAIAASAGASFIRVNVLSGTMFTDQGPIVGRAAEIARMRAHLAPDVSVLADVFVKHATPPPGLSLEQAAADLWERAAADAIVVSGAGTGRPTDIADARRVRGAVPDAPILIGSGVTPDSLATMVGVADGFIVGTWLKTAGNVGAPVDPGRAIEMVRASGRSGIPAPRA